MKTSRSTSSLSTGKRKLEGITVSDEEGAQKRTVAPTTGVRSNPASFSVATKVVSASSSSDDSLDAMKRSISWPNAKMSVDTVISPIAPLDMSAEVNVYDDSVLSSKFNQQNAMLLKHSVFRPQSAGVTKALHGKACDLIAGAAHTYNVAKGTTILAMHLFDRALSLTAVRKAEVTLLAATCLLIAAKVEEINPPYAEELAYYCGKRFEKSDVHAMEQVLLPLFQCHVSVPTRYDFAQRFCPAAGLSSREKSLVLFLLELSFLDYNLNYFLPSKVAAGAIHLVIQMLRHSSRCASIWTPRLERTTRCPERELVEVVQRLRLVHWNLDCCAMAGITQRYVAEEHYGLADTPPLPYSQLRFDNPALLSKVEKELPEYAECKVIEKK